MYVVDTTLMINDKASGALNKMIAKVEALNKGFQMLEKTIANTERLMLNFGRVAATSGASFLELNKGLTGANTRMGNTAQKAEAATLAMQNMARATQAAGLAYGGLAQHMNQANMASNRFGSAPAGMPGGRRSGGGHGGGRAHGIASHITKLPGHLAGKALDTIIMYDIAKEILLPGQERQDALAKLHGTRMFSPGQEKQAQILARQMTRDTPTSSITENIDLINELATGLQSAKKGLELAPAMRRKASVMDFMSDGGHGINKSKALAAGRILEQLGLQDAPTKEKEHVLDLIARASMSTKGVAGPAQMSHYLSMVGASRMGMNVDEIFSVGSYMIQEFGNKAGSRMNAANRALNFGTMTQGGALGLMSGGLLPQQSVAGMKAPDIKRMVQGVDTKGNKIPNAGLYMRELFQQDAHAWTFKALEKILQTKKISPEKFEKFSHKDMQNLLLPILGGINATGFDIVDTAFQQRHSISEHVKNFNLARPDETAKEQQENQSQKVIALNKAWNDFWADVGTTPIIMNSVNTALTNMSSGLRNFSNSMEQINKAFPETAAKNKELADSMQLTGDSFKNIWTILQPGLDRLLGFFTQIANVGSILFNKLGHMNQGEFSGMFTEGDSQANARTKGVKPGSSWLQRPNSSGLLPPPPAVPLMQWMDQTAGQFMGGGANTPTVKHEVAVKPDNTHLTEAMKQVFASPQAQRALSAGWSKDYMKAAKKHNATTGVAGGNQTDNWAGGNIY